MISVSEALAHIRRHTLNLGSETIATGEAFNRVLNHDIHAKIDMPAFTSSSMDGFAISDCTAGDELTVIGESAAGTPFAGNVGRGETVRISTGAMLPSGADRILIQEHTSLQDGIVIVVKAPVANTFVRTKASGFSAGTCLISAGTRLTSAHLTLCAAGNIANLPVSRKPKVALVSSGNELRPLGVPLDSGQIIAANAIGLKALLEHWGAEVSNTGIIRDTQDKIEAHLSTLSNFDIIIPIGGASVGNHDFMRPAFHAAGFSPIFDTIAIKPGKPCWMGRRRGQVVFGLPGNPASALVCAHIFLAALLGRETQYTAVTLSAPVEENGPRETYLRAKVTHEDAQLFATPFSVQDSFRLLPQAKSNALIRIPPMGGPYKAGDRLTALRFGSQDAAW